MRNTYGYLEDFINERRSNGKYTFSLAELPAKLGKSKKAIVQGLQRLNTKKEIVSIRRGFYAIVTPEYRSKGIPPPSLFIADLMAFLHRDYYVGLLNAAVYYGAAHQQPQNFSVIIGRPALRTINKPNLHLNFYVKKEWANEDVIDKKVDTGYIGVSSPELTALDLVFFYDQVGGFNRIATVLDELSESMEASKLVDTAKRFYQITTVQRLGYILDKVLQKHKLSTSLASYLRSVNHFPVQLRPQKKRPNKMIARNPWKIIPNIEIETDL